MEHLRIDTTNLVRKRDEDCIQPGLLTPLPSATEGRRDSIESGQWSRSFGSLSSFASQGPSTPTNLDSSGDCFHPTCEMPDGYVVVHQTPFGLRSSPRAVTTGIPCTPVTPTAGCSSHQGHSWSWPLNLGDPGFVSTVPRGICLSSEHLSAFQSHVPSDPWSSTDTVADTAASFNSSFHLTSDVSHCMPFDGPYETEVYDPMPLNHLRQPLSVSEAALASTVAPMETCVDQGWTMVDRSPVSDRSQTRKMSESYSPSPVDREWAKAESDPDYTPPRHSMVTTERAMLELPTGGKGVQKRKEKRYPIRPRRRRSDEVVIRGKQFDMHMEGAFMMTEDGKARPVAGPKKTKHVCNFVSKDGRRCDRAFERIEHLRRHLDSTHNKEKPFKCCLFPLDCKNGAFSRRDNLRSHLETHLNPARSGRNKRFTEPDVFYNYIWQAEDSLEEARKKISYLERKRKAGSWGETFAALDVEFDMDQPIISSKL